MTTVSEKMVSTEWTMQKLCWVPDEKEGYLLGSIKNETEDKFLIELCTTGSQVSVNRCDVQPANPKMCSQIENMSELTHLNEASVLHNLKLRYQNDLIYTYSGLFCVVINPYKEIPIYGADVIAQFRGKRKTDMPPHVYAIADNAYRQMIQGQENQSILCTGESGAGKTENTKRIIEYLSNVAGVEQRNLERHLQVANPILEAFGNAKTSKNDNSSRFGKFIKIYFNAEGKIKGAQIETFLLEKSRVVRQSQHESGFHIFHQLISSDQKSDYYLEDGEKYRFLPSGNTDNTYSKEEFLKTKQSMNDMGFTNDEIESVFKTISAILLLGNLRFSKEEGTDTIVHDEGVMKKVCDLLGLDEQALQKAFTTPQIKVGQEVVRKKHNREQCEHSVNATAKACYQNMFQWLGERLNSCLERSHDQKSRFIGLLDIAGFEKFMHNCFEQLCINYTNEKLQHIFEHTMLTIEQEMYLQENVEWDTSVFVSNGDRTISLLEKGIFTILEEECLLQADHKRFYERVTETHKNNEKFVVPPHSSKNHFSIVHYAGPVVYQTGLMVEKNKDPLDDEVIEVFQNSSDVFVSSLWKTSDHGEVDTTGIRSRKGMFRTVCQMYKEQLNQLMTTLDATCPHFVRCILPNYEKKTGKINSNLVLEQLRCNGVLDGIRICRQGFPSRVLFQEFRHRYKILTPDTISKHSIDGKDSVQKMIDVLAIDTDLYRIGRTKVFFKAGVLASLEEQRDQRLVVLITRLQAHWRGVCSRRRYRALIDQQERSRDELNHLNRVREEKEHAFANMQRRLAAAEGQIQEMNEQIQEETRLKIAHINRARQLEAAADARKKADEGVNQQLAEIRQKYRKEIEDLQQKLEKGNAEKERIAQSKKKIQQEFEDISMELDNVRTSHKDSEKRQKKFEAEQLEVSNRLKEEYSKQLKKDQQIIKDYQIECEEARQAKEDIAAQLRETERKLRAVEAEREQLREANEGLQQAHRLLKLENNELEELRSKGGGISTEEKRRLEAMIAQLEEELEEEQSSCEIAIEKQRKAQGQLEQITTERSMERTLNQKTDAEKQSLERVCRDLKAKITEFESGSQSRSRAQMAALEAKIQYLEDQLTNEGQDKTAANRAARRLEKRLNDITQQLEDEKRASEQAKRMLEKSNVKNETLRRQRDELEEENSRERTKSRTIQREFDDLQDAHEQLNREVLNLRGNANRRRAESFRLRRRFDIPGSSDDLTNREDESESNVSGSEHGTSVN